MQAESGMFAATTGGTTQNVSASFQGRAIIMYAVPITSENTETATASLSMAFFDDSSHHSATGWAGNDAVATTKTWRNPKSSGTPGLPIITTGTGTVNTRLTAVTFSASSFGVTWSSTPGAAYKIGYLLLGGSDIAQTFAGEFTDPSNPVSKSVTDPGFQGDLLLLLGYKTATDTPATNAGFMLGCATASKQWVVWVSAQNNAVATANAVGNSILRNDRCLVTGSISAPAEDYGASFTRFTASGFDLSFNLATGGPFLWQYLVIKGGKWDCGVSAKPTTAITQVVTGVNFKPIVMGLLMSSAVTLDTNTVQAITSFGTATGTSNRSYAAAGNSNVVPTVAKSSCSSTKISHEMLATANADFTSFDDSGFTITWDATGSAYQVGWFAGASSPTCPRIGIFSKDAVLTCGAFDTGVPDALYGWYDDDFVAQFSGTTVGATASGIASVPPGVFSKDATLDGAFDD